MAVVLDHRIGAALVDAARHLAAGEDMAGVPVGELARGLHLAQAQQPGDHHRAVAHPAARVAARAGLQGRAVARHQDVGQRRGQRVGDARAIAGQLQRDAAQAFAPVRGGGVEARVEFSRRGRSGWHAAQRRQHAHRLRCPRCQRERPLQQRRRVCLWIAQLAPFSGRPQRRLQRGHAKPAVERQRGEALRRGREVQWFAAIDRQRARVRVQRVDRTGAAGRGQELLRRVHLPRPQRQQQREGLWPPASVVQRVAGQRLRRVARAVGGGLDVKREGGVRPRHGGQWQSAIAQGLRAFDTGPVHPRAVFQQHGGFKAVTRAPDFERTVLAEQRTARAAAVDADQCPVVLLADEGPRQVAARRVGGQRGQHAVEVGPLGGTLQHRPRQVRAPTQGHAQMARLALGQEQRVEPAVTAANTAEQAPCAAIVAGEQRVVQAACASGPLQRDAVEFTGYAKVDVGAAGGRSHHRFSPGRWVGFAFAQAQRRDAQGTLPAAAARGDDELDELRLAQRAVGSGPPREAEVAAAQTPVRQLRG